MVQATAKPAERPAHGSRPPGVPDDLHPTPRDTARLKVSLCVLGLLALAALALSQADERAVFLWFNHAPFLPGAVWEGLSVLGLGVSASIALLVWLQTSRPQVVAALCLSFLTVGLPINLLKRLIERPRPVAVLPPELFEVLGRPLTHGSMPSGHSGTAMAVMALVLLARPAVPQRALSRPIVVVLCLGVLWSRMACGAHWPWDVVVGGSIGWLGGWLAMALADRSHLSRWCGSERAQPWLIALLLLASVASGFDHIGYPGAVALQVAIAVVGSATALWRAGHWLRRRRGPAA